MLSLDWNRLIFPSEIERILNWISSFESVRSVINGAEIHVQSLTDEMRRQIGAPSNAGSIFFYDGRKKTIYLDYSQPLSLLIQELVHEAVHHADQEYIDGYHESLKLNGTARAIFEQRRVLHSERKAYRAQYEFTRELCNRYPSYRGPLAALQRQGRPVGLLVSDEEIILNYRLNLLKEPEVPASFSPRLLEPASPEGEAEGNRGRIGEEEWLVEFGE